MWRDLERICESLALPLRRPDPFPQNSLLAARVALALDDDIRPAFSRAVFAAEFGEGKSIADRDVIAGLLAQLGLDAEASLSKAQSEPNKARLRAQCDRAAEIGIFGAPTLVTAGGEMFWGDDRLQQGLDWARERG